jgi:hypothetical protein
MAGLYADVPGARVPYHVDGTLVRYVTSTVGGAVNGSWNAWTAGDATEMNDGDTTDIYFSVPGSTGRLLGWVFPQPVNLVGHNILLNASGGTPLIGTLDYSTNTTDGTDGTWNSTSSSTDSSIGSALRSITTVSLSGLRGLRLNCASNSGITTNWYIRDIAFYGTWTPATLAGWHPTLDQQIGGAHLDFGDIALGTAVTKQFRIKNGAAATANNVVVSVGDGNTVTVAGLSLSLDNATYATTRTIPSIAPGAISPVVYVRRSVLVTENQGNIGIAPIKFAATTWT